MILRIALIFLTNICAVYLSAQVINIESLRIRTDTTGWFGEVILGGQLKNSETKVISANFNSVVEYKGKKSLILLAGNYNFLAGDGKKLTDDFIIHLRYNYKFNHLIRFELFTQFQQNEILMIQERWLNGTGLRFKLADIENFRAYLGFLGMFEVEKEAAEPNPGLIRSDWRNSDYFSFTIGMSEHLELISTTYYQPLFSDFNDFRILTNNELNVKAGKRLSLILRYNLLYDSKPVSEVVNSVSSLSMAMKFVFK